MESEIQTGTIIFVEELGKTCVHFICEYCGKEIYKPVMYVRDPKVQFLGLVDDLVLNLNHCCKSNMAFNFTKVKFNKQNGHSVLL
jgi:hypothetical protein